MHVYPCLCVATPLLAVFHLQRFCLFVKWNFVVCRYTTREHTYVLCINCMLSHTFPIRNRIVGTKQDSYFNLTSAIQIISDYYFLHWNDKDVQALHIFESILWQDIDVHPFQSLLFSVFESVCIARWVVRVVVVGYLVDHYSLKCIGVVVVVFVQQFDL